MRDIEKRGEEGTGRSFHWHGNIKKAFGNERAQGGKGNGEDGEKKQLQISLQVQYWKLVLCNANKHVGRVKWCGHQSVGFPTPVPHSHEEKNTIIFTGGQLEDQPSKKPGSQGAQRADPRVMILSGRGWEEPAHVFFFFLVCFFPFFLPFFLP